MNDILKTVKDIIADMNLKVVAEDNDHVAVRYQFNDIYFVYNKDNDNYLSVILSEFDSADDDNRDAKIAFCNELSYTMKVVKFSVIQRVIIASYEFFFLNEDDFKYHVKKSLNILVAAKNNYIKHKNE